VFLELGPQCLPGDGGAGTTVEAEEASRASVQDATMIMAARFQH
jgi:hypothetical protein